MTQKNPIVAKIMQFMLNGYYFQADDLARKHKINLQKTIDENGYDIFSSSHSGKSLRAYELCNRSELATPLMDKCAKTPDVIPAQTKILTICNCDNLKWTMAKPMDGNKIQLKVIRLYNCTVDFSKIEIPSSVKQIVHYNCKFINLDKGKKYSILEDNFFGI